MSAAILTLFELGFPWATFDPFLFCVHHEDFYPAGNDALGPAASLAGRNLGMDFTIKDGWRMYHGDVVPGFPRHPHRGFETVTVARRGFIDHSDSLGATARYGEGDVQWMTAGQGIVHAEMFPLLREDAPNTCELFQIWLNLPAADKMVEPHFSMLWAPTIPTYRPSARDDAAGEVEVRVIAGSVGGHRAPAPPPNSWASAADSEVAIWTIRLGPKARLRLPPAPAGVLRTLYYFRGDGVSVADRSLPHHCGIRLDPQAPAQIEAGDSAVELLLLQGRPIGEPVARHGPFVMNTDAEIARAYSDYRQTQFGGWPWPSPEPVHPRTEDRFALRPGGVIETPSRT
ncbi:MAG: pirin family protein [Myxococcales bacterium]|nr:pirin family protein [Myxococcales bacterium]